jgi:hypothetical protein
MGFFSRLNGIVGSFLQIGGPSGPAVKAPSTTALEARNAADNDYVVMRVGTPLGDNDAVTKAYADEAAYSKPVTDQISGASAAPSNTAVAHWIVVTTTGGNANIGDLYYDDGTNTGTAAKVVAKAGNSIVTTAAFTGGTISLDAQQHYVWTGSIWLNIAANVSGAQYVVDFAITTGASQSSTKAIPANAVITRCLVQITTPYSGGATITVGRTGSAALLMAAADNVATVAGDYDAPQRTGWGASELAVLVTVAGSPGAGAGRVLVAYSVPNA